MTIGQLLENIKIRKRLTLVTSIFVGGLVLIGASKSMVPHTIEITLPEKNNHDEPTILFEDNYDIPPHVTVPTTDNTQYSRGEELDCLAKNLYFEARDQTNEGKLAVGLVTLNRVISRNFPDSICDVVWQKRWSKQHRKWVAQFSWTLDGKSDVPRNSVAFQDALHFAEALMDKNSAIVDFTMGALHYHASYVSPYWAKKLTLVAQFDDHLFYH